MLAPRMNAPTVNPVAGARSQDGRHTNVRPLDRGWPLPPVAGQLPNRFYCPERQGLGGCL